jgi:adenosylcobinamide-GDP ribazoletransferase
LYWHFLSDAADARDVLILTLSWLFSVSFIWVWWRSKLKRWLGGYTGDCLGAMQQMTELAFYLGVLAYFGFIS